MAQFVNPWVVNTPGYVMSKSELVRALRQSLAAEHEAVHLYMAYADATSSTAARKVFIDIANEERVHAGEFERLIEILTGDEDKYLQQGAAEVDKMLDEGSKPRGMPLLGIDSFTNSPANDTYHEDRTITFDFSYLNYGGK